MGSSRLTSSQPHLNLLKTEENLRSRSAVQGRIKNSPNPINGHFPTNVHFPINGRFPTNGQFPTNGRFPSNGQRLRGRWPLN